MFIGDTLSTKAEITVSLYWQYLQRPFSYHSSQGYVYFIMTERCHNRGSYPPLTIGPADVLSPPVENDSTLCKWHWNSCSIRISLPIQQLSNYVHSISVQWVSTAWYGSGVCDTFFITEWVYPARPLPLPPVHHFLSEIELELCILGLYYSIDSSST